MNFPKVTAAAPRFVKPSDLQDKEGWLCLARRWQLSKASTAQWVIH